MIDRRTFLVTAAALAACGQTPSLVRNEARAAEPSTPDFAPILTTLGAGARLGVAALDSGSGRTLRHDAESRYAMCSTFKLPLAAVVLAEVDAGRLTLDQPLAFGAQDMIAHAPVAERLLPRGHVTVAEACDAVVEVSDNVCANLLMRQLGGPDALTAAFRRWGDSETRVDRYELALNSNLPDDPRDTTTPAAMLRLLRTILLGPALRERTHALVIGAMERCATGRARLRAGLPSGWRAGDKTGTGARGAANDIGFAVPPGRPPILIASYLSAPEATPDVRNAAHAAVARLVAAALS